MTSTVGFQSPMKRLLVVLLTEGKYMIDQRKPIPMILHCPTCGLQHIDEAEMPPMTYALGMVAASTRPLWGNPPHRSHLCARCSCIWRPADVPTEGVQAVATRGEKDTWPSM